jgi:hypothetical protein
MTRPPRPSDNSDDGSGVGNVVDDVGEYAATVVAPPSWNVYVPDVNSVAFVLMTRVSLVWPGFASLGPRKLKATTLPSAVRSDDPGATSPDPATYPTLVVKPAKLYAVTRSSLERLLASLWNLYTKSSVPEVSRTTYAEYVPFSAGVLNVPEVDATVVKPDVVNGSAVAVGVTVVPGVRSCAFAADVQTRTPTMASQTSERQLIQEPSSQFVINS